MNYDTRIKLKHQKKKTTITVVNIFAEITNSCIFKIFIVNNYSNLNIDGITVFYSIIYN